MSGDVEAGWYWARAKCRYQDKIRVLEAELQQAREQIRRVREEASAVKSYPFKLEGLFQKIKEMEVPHAE